MTLTRTRPGISSDEARALRDQYVPTGLSVGTPMVGARAAGAEVGTATAAFLSTAATDLGQQTVTSVTGQSATGSTPVHG